MLLVYHHIIDVTFLSLLNKVVKPAVFVLRLRLLLNHELSPVHRGVMCGQEQVLELLNLILVDHRHDRVWPTLIILVIEGLETVLDVVKGENRIAKVRLVTIEDPALKLGLIAFKSHAVVS